MNGIHKLKDELRAKVISIKTRKPTLSLVGPPKKVYRLARWRGVTKRDEMKG